MVEEKMALERYAVEESISRAPEFLVRLRSHTVWEKMSVRLYCTVQGFPTPVVQWYKNEELITPASEPGKYTIESKYGVHVLDINRAHYDDTATYTAVATNVHGQASTNAAVIVRRYRGDEEPYPVGLFPYRLPLPDEICFTHFDVQLLERFEVTFGTEGETLALRCNILVTPELKRLHPRVEWYRDVTGLLEGRSYIFRVRAVNQAGISRPSRSSDAVAALDPVDLERSQTILTEGSRDIVLHYDDFEGDVKIPGPPTNVHGSETSRTYVVLSWDPPVPRGRDPLSYFIEKSVVGSGTWQRVNAEVPVRSPRYAVFDLAEGKSYVFRVLSANKHGISDPSEITPPIQAKEAIVVPSAPGRVVATRNTKTSVIVNWDRSKHEEDLIGYYIDYSVVGSNHWEPCNHKPIKYNRFTMHGLTTGEKYIFRVKAANAVGMSENSQESDPITVQAALTCPSYPYGITLLNCDGQSMTIGWKLPRYSGGSNILGYYIDKREAEHHNWHEVNSSLVKERIYKVEDLQENAYYEFKIVATNITGIGKSSEPSEFFKCEAWDMPEPVLHVVFQQHCSSTLVVTQLTMQNFHVAVCEAGAPRPWQQENFPFGPPYDLTFCEIRNTSLVILWKAPIYIGNSPVTGYFVDYKEEEEENWTTFNEKPISHRYLKVTELHEGKCYMFRVRPVNDAGIGKPSDVSEAVLVQAKPGTKEISAGVDEEGTIYLEFDCKEISDASQFTWSKFYKEIDETNKFNIETIGDQ
ncbi:myomesin-2 [Crotalus adamanteus]|uniref:Myomesin-2 n=1 Tax=Crotalus adamanteus TaxID=8729 RepID=A0AAW1C9X2_CROAD